MGYSYRPELKVDDQLSRIDFGNPALRPMIRMLVKNQSAASRSYRPEKGVISRMVSIPSEHDGSLIEYFILEPEKLRQNAPAMLYCHGGAFLLPLQVSALEMAARFAREMNMRVYVPEYRLLPQYPAPAAFWDCYSVWKIMAARGHSALLIYGESAGGCLAAGLSRYIRDKGNVKPHGQLLIYPVVDTVNEKRLSVRAYEMGVWPLKSNRYMWQNYLRNGLSGLESYLLPLQNREFQNLPPAYIEPQEIDILRDEAVEYADALKSAGVPVWCNEIKGSYHGFDADMKNPFVLKIIQQRILVAKSMLEKSAWR